MLWPTTPSLLGVPGLENQVAIKERTIPKTTSGKIQRRRSRELLHQGELAVVTELTAPVRKVVATSSPFRNLSNVADFYTEHSLCRFDAYPLRIHAKGTAQTAVP